LNHIPVELDVVKYCKTVSSGHSEVVDCTFVAVLLSAYPSVVFQVQPWYESNRNRLPIAGAFSTLPDDEFNAERDLLLLSFLQSFAFLQ
jgi:hypothetical protein